jgi:CRP-like cAMP-binding protein
LGAAAVILGGRSELTAQCASQVEARPLDVNDFRRMLATNHAISGWIQRMLAREVREQASRMGQFLLKPAARLQWVLSALTPRAEAESDSTNDRLVFPINHYERADAIGTKRETVTRLLKDADRRGTIYRKGGWIRVASGRRTGS